MAKRNERGRFEGEADPSPEEIERAKEAIRGGWDFFKQQKREAKSRRKVVPPRKGILIRVTDEERTFLHMLAAEAGVNLQAFIVDTIKREHGWPPNNLRKESAA